MARRAEDVGLHRVGVARLVEVLLGDVYVLLHLIELVDRVVVLLGGELELAVQRVELVLEPVEALLLREKVAAELGGPLVHADADLGAFARRLAGAGVERVGRPTVSERVVCAYR